MEWSCGLLLLASVLVYSKALVPQIKLNDGHEIPAIAFGTYLGHDVLPTSNATEDAVWWAIDAGYRHIDTATRYKIEDQVGKAIAAKIKDGTVKRDDLFVTTKLFNNAHARDVVVPTLRESLRKLQLDYVDLYLIHWPIGEFDNKTFDLTDYLDTWRGMMEAKQLGLARSIGLSNFNTQQMDRIAAEGLEKPAVVQVEINLNLQQPALLSYCKHHNIAVMGYTPFGSIFPSRARPDAPPPRVDDQTLVDIARKYNKTVPQVVLRYLVELGVIPIPKSVTKLRIEENIQIFDFTLTQEDRNLLKGYDRGYRVLPQLKWKDHPHYPFEMN